MNSFLLYSVRQNKLIFSAQDFFITVKIGFSSFFEKKLAGREEGSAKKYDGSTYF